MGKGGDSKAKHGYGAFAKDDVDDAKRGEPTGTLEGYAASRGLIFAGQQRFGAFAGILPEYPEYIFNVARGVVPGGGVGMVEHELQEVDVDQSRGIMWGGEFFSTHYTAKGKGFWNTVLPVEIFDKQPPKEPFAASALWAPVSAAIVRVPEAALLPRFLVRRKERLASGSPKLDEFGAAGYRVDSPASTPEIRAAIFGGDVAEVLRTLPYPHVEVRCSHGGVALRRNGFVMDDDRLDDLAEAASRIARGLAQAAASRLHPQPFAVELPPPGERPPADVPWFEWPFSPWPEMYQAAATELGLTREDPAEFHRAFPTQPVPGLANAVLRGALPGWDGVEGRVIFTVHGHGTEHQVRGAVLIAAPPEAPAFAPGGEKIEATDQYVEVVDGVAAIWNRVRTVGQLDAAGTVERALATARQAGLVQP